MFVLSDVTYRIPRNRRAKPRVVNADCLKPYLGPALESWASKEVETVVPVVSPPLSAERSEPVIADSAVSAQLRGQSPNPALDNSLYATTAMLQEIGSDSDSVADSVVNEGQDNLANSGISVQEDARSRHGRERRKPQRYGEWA